MVLADDLRRLRTESSRRERRVPVARRAAVAPAVPRVVAALVARPVRRLVPCGHQQLNRVAERHRVRQAAAVLQAKRRRDDAVDIHPPSLPRRCRRRTFSKASRCGRVAWLPMSHAPKGRVACQAMLEVKRTRRCEPRRVPIALRSASRTFGYFIQRYNCMHRLRNARSSLRPQLGWASRLACPSRAAEYRNSSLADAIRT